MPTVDSSNGSKAEVASGCPESPSASCPSVEERKRVINAYCEGRGPYPPFWGTEPALDDLPKWEDWDGVTWEGSSCWRETRGTPSASPRCGSARSGPPEARKAPCWRESRSSALTPCCASERLTRRVTDKMTR